MNTTIRLSTGLLIVLILALTTIPLQAQSPAATPNAEDAPAQAAGNFFQVLANSKDATAWQMLSEKSKTDFIKQIAAEGKVEESKVKGYFDQGEPTVLKTFWNLWRTELRVDAIARLATFKTSQQDAGTATVELSVPGLKKTLQLKMVKEGTEWKVGLVETFFPNGLTTDSVVPAPTPTVAAGSAPPAAPKPQTLDPNEPAAAVKGFFSALAGGDYKAAWGLFTDHTQDAFVQVAASQGKKSEADVRKQFVEADTEMQQGFWDPFRRSSFSDQIAEQATMSSGLVDGTKSSVQITMPNGKSVSLLTFKDHGSWKIGWVETFFPNGLKVDK